MKLLVRVSTYLWLFIAILFALLVKPLTVEMIGIGDGGTKRPGVVDSIDSTSHYSAQDGLTTTSYIYTFKDREGNTYGASGLASLHDLRSDDQVILGIVGDELATVNGEFVASIGFWERIGFGIMLTLTVFALGLNSTEKRGDKAHEPWIAFVVAAIFVLPAVIGSLLTLGLSFGAEALNIAPWPLILVITAICIGFYVRRRVDRSLESKTA